MLANELQERVIEEIRQIPESRLPEIFDILHFFRLGIQSAESTGKTPISTFQQDTDSIAAFRGKGRGGASERLLAERQADRERE